MELRKQPQKDPAPSQRHARRRADGTARAPGSLPRNLNDWLHAERELPVEQERPAGPGQQARAVGGGDALPKFPMRKKFQAMSITRSTGGEQTRQQIMDAALRLFAAHGYAGTSTQAIVDASHVTKPVLYYHFGSKVGLFGVVVDETGNQLLEVILKSKAGASNVSGQMVEICAAIFQFARGNPSVIGLALELLRTVQQCPSWKPCLGKAHQPHVVIGKLMKQAVDEGILREEFSNDELVIGFLGLIRNHILHFLSNPQWPLSRHTAEHVVFLFLNGAATGKSKSFQTTQPIEKCAK